MTCFIWIAIIALVIWGFWYLSEIRHDPLPPLRSGTAEQNKAELDFMLGQPTKWEKEQMCELNCCKKKTKTLKVFTDEYGVCSMEIQPSALSRIKSTVNRNTINEQTVNSAIDALNTAIEEAESSGNFYIDMRASHDEFLLRDKIESYYKERGYYIAFSPVMQNEEHVVIIAW